MLDKDVERKRRVDIPSRRFCSPSEPFYEIFKYP